MKLLCHAINDYPPKIIAARPDRKWMDDFPERHPYRCLPLAIANAHGWEVLCPVPIEIEWNGGPAAEDLTIRALKPMPGNRLLDHFCRSNFTRGIVTFHLDYIFQTDPEWDLLATGPVNEPKDNAYPLTGIMETDWLAYPFTMNWQVMRPGRVVFEENEPYCFIFPIKKQALVDCEPEIHRVEDDAERNRQLLMLSNERDEFLKKFTAGDPETHKKGWLKHYFIGQHPDGTPVEGHINKLRLKEPVDRRSPKVVSPPAETPSTPEHIREAVATKRTDPKWEDWSSLNRMEVGPSSHNVAGRQRIDGEGRLTKGALYPRVVSSSKDAVGRDFLVVDELITAEQCEMVCRAFEELSELMVIEDQYDPFWHNRFIWFTDIIKQSGRLLGEIMRTAMGQVIKLISEFYFLKAPIYPDLLQIVKWHQGMSMVPHADNAHPDGSPPHNMPHRDFAGVLYLDQTHYEGVRTLFYWAGRCAEAQAGNVCGVHRWLPSRAWRSARWCGAGST